MSVILVLSLLRWHAPFNCHKWVYCRKIRKKGWEGIFFKVWFLNIYPKYSLGKV